MDKVKLDLSLDKSIDQFLKFSNLDSKYKKMILEIFDYQKNMLLKIIDLAEETCRYKELVDNYKMLKQQK